MRLGFIGSMYGIRRGPEFHVHLSLGRILDHLAHECDVLHVTLPVYDNLIDGTRDYALSARNIRIIPQQGYRSSLGGLRQGFGLIRSYARVIDESDHVVIRGMVPLIEWVYILCIFKRVVPVHWLVGNPQALMASHERAGRLKDLAFRIIADFQAKACKILRPMARGWFVCNGQELADLFQGRQTLTVVSSTVTVDEICERYDACQDQSLLRVLFVGFLRPEKGLEFLIKALASLPVGIEWRLEVVGSAGGFTRYQDTLHRLVGELECEDRITWRGYVSYGSELRTIMQGADVLVLPTLSEGTPRVLVEARANGLPVVATNVGGIPTSVRDGHDGLLVPSKDAPAIADALVRLRRDPVLALGLIRNGYATVREFTVERFVARIAKICREGISD